MAVTIVTDSTFQSEVLDFNGVVLVDFFADWCGPCKMIAPEIAMLAGEMEIHDDMKVVKVDTDANPELSQKYSIRSIPTIMIFKNGQLVKQTAGAMRKDKYKQMMLDAQSGGDVIDMNSYRTPTAA